MSAYRVILRPAVEPRLPWRWLRLWRSLLLAAVLVTMGLACGRPPQPAKPKRREGVTPPVYVFVPVNCLSPPPAVYVPSWPTPDKMGNVIMHASTMDGLREALVEYRRYIDTEYSRCADAALASPMEWNGYGGATL